MKAGSFTRIAHAALICLIFTKGGAAVSQRVIGNLTSADGIFCVSVHDADDAPADMAAAEQIYWYTAPKMSVALEVQVAVREVFTVPVVQYRLGEVLTQGQHTLTYHHMVGKQLQHHLLLLVDGVQQKPHAPPVDHRTSDSSFSAVRVNAKGPITVQWGMRCGEGQEGSGADDVHQTTESSLFMHKEVKVTDKYENDKVVNETGLHHDAIGSNAEEESEHESEAAIDADGTADEVIESRASSEDAPKAGVPVWLIVLLSLLGVAGAGLLCYLVYYFRSVRPKQKQLSRRAAAEREKQRSIRDAKRLSYQEQLRWAENAKPFVESRRSNV